MSRHHPYGGPSYDNAGPRRGGSPAGPGPDRYHRFHDGPPRGRGFGRGRGRGSFGGSVSGYDANGGHGAYDQGPPQGDMGGYNNNYNSGSTQEDPFYQSGSYGGGGPSQYGVSDTSGGYDQSYGNFEDNSGSNFGPPGSFGNRPQKRGPKRERDDKVHESIIEERIQRERPCRTLFIRNIKYETNSDEVRRQFEEHGEIKTFFDLIANRGMVFVTFYDLRAAERARERLQGSEIAGRPIDVHYSLPRDDNNAKGGEKNQELQGTLLVTLRNSVSGQPIDDGEVRRKFQQFGDVKAVRPIGDRSDQRYVEFYDTRSAEDAFDRLRHQGLQDGVMDITLAWDESAGPQQGPNNFREREPYDVAPGGGLGGGGGGSGPGGGGGGGGMGREWEDGPRGPPQRGRGRGRGRGGRGFGGGGGGVYDDDRRPHWESDRDRPRRFDDDYGGGRGGGRGGYGGDRFDRGRDSYNTAPPPQNTYGAPPPPLYNEPPPPAALPPVDDRLDQARKVQQLLAALKQPQTGSPAAVPAPPPQQQPPPHVPQAPPTQNSYYPPGGSQPPMGYNSMPSSITGYPPMPPSGGPPQQQGPPGQLAGLPQGLLALLQTAQSQPSPSGTPPQMGAPPGQYGGLPLHPPGPMRPPMPPHLAGPPPPGVPMQSGMGSEYGAHSAQLMSYLAAGKRQ